MSKEFKHFFEVVGNMNLPANLETDLIDQITTTLIKKMQDNRIEAEELKTFYENTKHIDEELGIDIIRSFWECAVNDGRCEQCFTTITDNDYICEDVIIEDKEATISQRIETGYKCHKCGTTKTF